MLSTTVTVWPPGFTVSCPSRATRLVKVTVTVTFAPAASDAEEGDTVSLPATAGAEYRSSLSAFGSVGMPKPGNPVSMC